MIKLLHTSDWHLGKTLGQKSLIDDQRYFIENVFYKIIEKENPDAVIIAGDIFDRAVPPTKAISLFNNLLLHFGKQLKIPLIIISGNHDSKSRMAVGTELLNSSGIYIANSIESIQKPISIKKGKQSVNIYTLPYFDKAELKNILNLDKDLSLSEYYRELIAKANLNFSENSFNILVSHCYVTGYLDSEEENSLLIGGNEEISSSVFEKFDYVALGHIHSAQKAGINGRYSGSPICYSFREKSYNKSISILEIEQNKNNLRIVPINPLHKMKVIEGEFKDLVEMGKASPSDDYIRVNLTNKTPIYMPIEQLRVYFPNIITLSSEWVKSTSINTDFKAEFKDKILNNTENELTAFSEFFKSLYGDNPSHKDTIAFKEILQFMKKEESE